MTTSDRRAELLALAANMFAQRGMRATTVRDIADAAGILSGSLYHHFDSKEAMVDEILRGFLDPLFERYHAIVAEQLGPRETLEAIVIASFAALDNDHDAVAIYQAEARHLATQARFSYIPERLDEFRTMWHTLLKNGMADGEFRADLDVDLTYRFMRDTVWVPVGWYRPGGGLTIDEIARQYLSIVIHGIDGGATRRGPARRNGGNHG